MDKLTLEEFVKEVSPIKPNEAQGKLLAMIDNGELKGRRLVVISSPRQIGVSLLYRAYMDAVAEWEARKAKT